jgi:hypothetical protein
MKRFILLSVFFLICIVSQAQMVKSRQVEVQKKVTNTATVKRVDPKKSVPLKKKIITTRISIQTADLRQKKQ